MTYPAWFEYEYADICRAVGVIGFLGYVVNYMLLCLRVLTSEHITYFIINIAAASMVLVSLTEEFNLASALIQSFWIVIGLLAIVLRLRMRQTVDSGRLHRAGL